MEVQHFQIVNLFFGLIRISKQEKGKKMKPFYRFPSVITAVVVVLIMVILGLLFRVVEVDQARQLELNPRPTITRQATRPIVTFTSVPPLSYANNMVVSITGSMEGVFAANIRIEAIIPEGIRESEPIKYLVTSNGRACYSGPTTNAKYVCELNNLAGGLNSTVPLTGIKVSIPGCFQDYIPKLSEDGKTFKPEYVFCDP